MSKRGKALNKIFTHYMSVSSTNRSELARRLNVPRQTVTDTLNNPNQNWSVDQLDRYAAALNLQVVVYILPNEKFFHHKAAEEAIEGVSV